MIPFFNNLDKAKRLLIAGCGGGFDVFAGIPLAIRSFAAGKEIVFANYSFTNLWLCGGERVGPTAWRIDKQSNEIPYFPEKWLAEWLANQGQVSPIYTFAKSGVKPLTDAYKLILERHAIDLIILVDGGTDSILFGDEPGLGTAAEDAVSTVAACAATEGQVLLAAIGFGIDHHHGVSHHAFLENVAQLIRQSGFLGAFSVTDRTDEHRMQFYSERDARRVRGLPCNQSNQRKRAFHQPIDDPILDIRCTQGRIQYSLCC